MTDPCLNVYENRVLMQSWNLTDSFTPAITIQNLALSDGCLVQSHTVNRLLQMSFSCTTGSYQCKLTIPCVVPRLLMTFSYHLEEPQGLDGMVLVEVHDRPIDIAVNIVRDNNGACTLLRDIDDSFLRNYRVYTTYEVEKRQLQQLIRVELMVKQLTETGWPYHTYKEEVAQFLFDVVTEAYYQRYNIFPTDQQLMLRQYCRSISIQPIIPPTLPPTTPWPTVTPVPPTRPTDLCRDDYYEFRINEFNVIRSDLVIRHIDEPYECVNPLIQRVVLADRQLSPYFELNKQIHDFYLYNGCLVQHITLSYEDHISVDCTSRSDVCVVSIPCVVPRVVIGYDFAYHRTTGVVVLEIRGRPITIQVPVSRHADRVCTIVNVINDQLLSGYRVLLNMGQVTQEINDLLYQTLNDRGWLFTVYMEEVKGFVFRVIQEAFSGTNRIFPPLDVLHQFCNVILPPIHPTVPPTPTPYPPPTTPYPPYTTPYPPHTICTDEFEQDRVYLFNHVDTTKVIQVFGKDYPGLDVYVPRVLLQPRNLTNAFQFSLTFQNLILSRGCLVQSINVASTLQPSFDCTTGSYQCRVTIPNVAPRVTLTYMYTVSGRLDLGVGVVVVEVKDIPTAITLSFTRDNNNECTVLNEIDDNILANYKVNIYRGEEDTGLFEYARTILDQLVLERWPYHVYKEEVRQFLFEVVMELFYQKHRIFPGSVQRLREYCRSISIQPYVPYPTHPTPTRPTPVYTVCTDDFEQYRNYPFNYVDTTTIMTIYGEQEPGFNVYEHRVLLQPRNLTDVFSPLVTIQDMRLIQGCLVQSITVSQSVQLAFDCTTGSYQCKVTIPSVAPRILLTYWYTFLQMPNQNLGNVIVEVKDKPINLTLSFIRDNNNVCTIVNEIEDAILSHYRVSVAFRGENQQYIANVKPLMEILVQEDWPYLTYKEEVKQFLFDVLMEIYDRKYSIFPEEQQLRLRQYCRSISIQPRIPTDPTIWPPTIGPPTYRPITYPPITYPPITYPPITYRPITYPPITYPPITYRPITYPPITYRPITYPPITYRPITYPPITYPPITYPPITYPPITYPTPTYPPIRPTICTDDFEQDRTAAFNLVDTSKVISIIKVTNPCLNPYEKRVMMYPRNLTNSFSPTASVEDFRLHQGCLVQSHTVNRQLQLSFDCTTGSYQCRVTVPCVVPRVSLTYWYSFVNVPGDLGVVVVDVYNTARDITLSFIRDNNDRCTILNEIDDSKLADYKITITYKKETQRQNIPRVKDVMEKLIQQGWPFYTYIEEVKQYLFEILLEVYNQQYQVFPLDQQLRLRQYCKSISIQPPIPPGPHTTPRPTPPTPVIPETCRDVYMYNRTLDFNIINSLEVIRIVGGPNACVYPQQKRILIQDRQLSPYFQKAIKIGNVYLRNGCLVQGITVPYQTQMETDCTSRPDACVVSIPCVVPSIVVGYEYLYQVGTQTPLEGSVIMDVNDNPLTVQVIIFKSNDRLCKVAKEVDDEVTPTHKVSIRLKPNVQQVNDAINGFINSNSWLFTVYSQELKAFSIRVIQEAFSPSSEVFHTISVLSQYCDVILRDGSSYPTILTTTEFPSPTQYPYSTLPPGPAPEPAYCRDEYADSRINAFNLISSRRVMDILSRPFSCISAEGQRVLPGKRFYAFTVEPHVRINQLSLSGGCLVQSVTLPHGAVMREECSRPNECLVTVPCVVPRILIGYAFSYQASDGMTHQGTVVVEIHDDPLDIPVLVNTRDCQMMEIVDETTVLRSWRVTVAPDQRNPAVSDSVKNIMVDHIQRTGWPFNMYREEVKQVMIAVVTEAIHQHWHMIGNVPQLQRTCPGVDQRKLGPDSPKEEEDSLEVPKCVEGPINIEVKYDIAN